MSDDPATWTEAEMDTARAAIVVELRAFASKVGEFTQDDRQTMQALEARVQSIDSRKRILKDYPAPA